MDKKVAVVSGASRGLGLALAEAYLGGGHAVAAFSRSPSEELSRLAAKAGSDGDLFWTAVEGRNREGVRDFAIWLTQACAKVMLTQHRGSIVTISAINAAWGHAGVAIYSATKAALEGMTRSLARELGPRNIRVNALAPGFFDSEMVAGLSAQQKETIIRRTPLHRLPSVADIVDVVMFLTSEGAALITGQMIAVDGGLSC